MTYVKMIREILDESYFVLIYIRAKWHIPPRIDSNIFQMVGVWEKCSISALLKIIEILDHFKIQKTYCLHFYI
jgi:hypothetical protein